MKTQAFTISDIRSERLTLPFFFLSDNHLSTRSGPNQDKRIADMLDLLEQVKKSRGTLFILGDFFDFWFDKNDHIPSVLKPVVDALRSIADVGIEIHYLSGNHDYWIEGLLTQEIGVRFYPDALRFTYEGKKIFCLHGDQIVYENESYPWIRNLLHDPLAIGMLKVLPIQWTYKLGEKVSHYNQNIPEIPRISELLIAKMQHYLQGILDEGYDIAISGHVHAPHLETNMGKSHAILGDWIHHRTYGYMDETGFKLIEMT